MIPDVLGRAWDEIMRDREDALALAMRGRRHAGGPGVDPLGDRLPEPTSVFNNYAV